MSQATSTSRIIASKDSIRTNSTSILPSPDQKQSRSTPVSRRLLWCFHRSPLTRTTAVLRTASEGNFLQNTKISTSEFASAKPSATDPRVLSPRRQHCLCSPRRYWLRVLPIVDYLESRSIPLFILQIPCPHHVSLTNSPRPDLHRVGCEGHIAIAWRAKERQRRSGYGRDMRSEHFHFSNLGLALLPYTESGSARFR